MIFTILHIISLAANDPVFVYSAILLPGFNDSFLVIFNVVICRIAGLIFNYNMALERAYDGHMIYP